MSSIVLDPPADPAAAPVDPAARSAADELAELQDGPAEPACDPATAPAAGASDAPGEPALSLRARLRAVVDELQSLAWDALSDDQVVAVLTEVETAKRRLAPVDHAGINQLAQRSVAFARGARSTTAYLSNLLRISRPEAHARVAAAEQLGYRRTVTGQRVAPQFPMVAAAQAAGSISDRHAAVITKTVNRLPDKLADQYGQFVETTLVEQAATMDPVQLRGHADTLAYLLDQDGQLADAKHRDKTRCLHLHRRPDGSARLEGELTAEAAELLHSVLDTLTKPDGPDDRRNAGQRRHDAVVEALKGALRAQQIPNAGGVSCTVILTMDAESWLTGTGSARTGHGYTLPAPVAHRWTRHGRDAKFLLALLSKTKAVEAYSATQRIFTEQQRLALIARDGGCTHPGCDTAAAFTETHHIIAWAEGGPSSLDNATLVCPFHHRHALEEGGWQIVMLDGIPHWVPPITVDPQQRPIRNTRHDRPRPTLPDEHTD